MLAGCIPGTELYSLVPRTYPPSLPLFDTSSIFFPQARETYSLLSRSGLTCGILGTAQ